MSWSPVIRGGAQHGERSLRRFAVFALSVITLASEHGGAGRAGAADNVPADSVLLNDGQRLQGSILQTRFGFRTPYACLSLEKNWLSELWLADLSGGVHSVQTINGNRLTGLLEERSLSLKQAGREAVEIRRERIARVSFGAAPKGGMSKSGPTRWIDLRNGDRLSGQWVGDHLLVVTDSNQVQVSAADIGNLVFSSTLTNVSAVTVLLRDGRTLHGRLPVEDMEFDLDLGLRVLIHQESILKVVDTASSAILPAGAPASTSGPKGPEPMVWVPAGAFTMGSPPEEPGRDPDEGPQTRVIINSGFWIGRHEVTQGEFQKVMEMNPSHATGEQLRPVEKVTWFEAVEYCRKLTRLEESQGRLPENYVYRLPTEGEWEYACRAGTQTRFSHGQDLNETQLEEYAWFARNSESMTHPVGGRRPNALGLYDTHGNVWEWCLDRWEGKLPGGSVTNVPAAAQGNLRVARGGSWLYEAKGCRSANRDDYGPGNRCSDLGFRIVLAPVEP